jgi:nucleotide-binding universal stress UspA family protein
LARIHDGTLLVFHVVDALRESADVIVALVSKATAAMDALVEAEQSHLRGVRYTTEVTSGEVFAEILERADSWHADLIVVGPTGKATLIEKVLGRTSERIVRGAHCSVMIVRPPQPRPAEKDDSE